MKTEVINFKTEASLKHQAQQKASELGLSLTAVLNTYLRRFLRTDRVEFEESLEPSEYLKKVIAETEEEIKRGETVSFDSYPEEKKYLADLINNAQKRRKKTR